MKLQKLYSYIRQAVDAYSMIEEGDYIAIGLSGGKDSIALLYGLSGLRKFYPKKFDIVGVSVDLGYEGFDTEQIGRICEELEVSYHVVHTQIKQMIKKGECSLCARLRKGAFNDKIIELGCNKFAYAHNMDDVVETLMLSLMYEGRFSTFWPVTYYEDTKLTMIRPLVFAPKNEVVGFCNRQGIVPLKNPCPNDERTQRTYVRNLIDEMEHHSRGSKRRMMKAILSENPHWKMGDMK